MSQPEAARDEEEQDIQRQPPQHANDGRPAAHHATAAVSAISLLYLSSSCADKKNGEKKKREKKGKKGKKGYIAIFLLPSPPVHQKKD